MQWKVNTEDTQKKPSCRLFCLLAREAPLGLIVRRGPTNWTHLSLWHTDTDEIEYGQWLHAGIPQHNCDLSPGGSLFIYFASKYGRTPFNTWTAISRPPYFTALALWPVGDSYSGGGLFVNDNTILLDHQPISPPPQKVVRLPPSWFKVKMYVANQGELLHMACDRLLRDGWTRIQKGAWPSDRRLGILLQPEIFQKPHPAGTHNLVMKYLGPQRSEQGGYQDAYEFSFKEIATNNETVLESATWADLDHRQRLVFAKNDGCLYTYDFKTPEFSPQLLANVSEQRPKPVLTPRWAMTWLLREDLE